MRTRTIEKANEVVEKKGDFHEAFAVLLRQKVEFLMQHGLNRMNCIQFYTTIFNCLTNILETSGVKICNEAANYIAQEYYDGIRINGTQELDPGIFEKRANLENIPTKELKLMMVMLRSTEFVWPIIDEIKKRS